MRRQWGRKGAMLLGMGAIGAAGLTLARRARRRDVLSGKSVLITGGSRGLGFLLAREFGRLGCRVAICARNEAELNDARAALEPDVAAGLITIVCDITDRTQVTAMVQQATRAFGRIDILVNNAGIIQAGPLKSMTREDFERAMDVMFWGMLNCTFEVLPQMRSMMSGRIVNITSIGGIISVPHLLPYNCAKFAAQGFSEGLHAELAKDGIHVTTIAPGLIRNGSYLNAEFKGDAEKEFAWFAPSASLPLLSKRADHVAAEIVDAVRRREALHVVSLPAAIAARLHGLMPGTMAAIMSGVNKRLPDSDNTQSRKGRELDDESNSRALNLLTVAGRRNALKYNERRPQA